MPIRQVCHIETWRENFEAVHSFYDARRIAEANAEPNAAHRTLAAWQAKWPGRVLLLTQNIDRLLERAGCSSVIHLHGEIRKLQCHGCRATWEIGAEAYDRRGCPTCASRGDVKPAIVFFGEQAPRYSDLHTIVESLTDVDTALVVGTSGVVLPADQLFGYSRAHSILGELRAGRPDGRTRLHRMPLRPCDGTSAALAGDARPPDGSGVSDQVAPFASLLPPSTSRAGIAVGVAHRLRCAHGQSQTGASVHRQFSLQDRATGPAGVADDYGLTVPEAVGSWMVDEINARTTALGTTSSISLIEYKSIPYNDT